MFDTNPFFVCRNLAVKRHLSRSLSVEAAITQFELYESKVKDAQLTNREARVIAKEICGGEVKWDWDLPRTKEGYYHFQGGVAVSPPVARSLSIPSSF